MPITAVLQMELRDLSWYTAHGCCEQAVGAGCVLGGAAPH